MSFKKTLLLAFSLSAVLWAVPSSASEPSIPSLCLPRPIDWSQHRRQWMLAFDVSGSAKSMLPAFQRHAECLLELAGPLDTVSVAMFGYDRSGSVKIIAPEVPLSRRHELVSVIRGLTNAGGNTLTLFTPVLAAHSQWLRNSVQHSPIVVTFSDGISDARSGGVAASLREAEVGFAELGSVIEAAGASKMGILASPTDTKVIAEYFRGNAITQKSALRSSHVECLVAPTLTVSNAQLSVRPNFWPWGDATAQLTFKASLNCGSRYIDFSSARLQTGGEQAVSLPDLPSSLLLDQRAQDVANELTAIDVNSSEAAELMLMSGESVDVTVNKRGWLELYGSSVAWWVGGILGSVALVGGALVLFGPRRRLVVSAPGAAAGHLQLSKKMLFSLGAPGSDLVFHRANQTFAKLRVKNGKAILTPIVSGVVLQGTSVLKGRDFELCAGVNDLVVTVNGAEELRARLVVEKVWRRLTRASPRKRPSPAALPPFESKRSGGKDPRSW